MLTLIISVLIGILNSVFGAPILNDDALTITSIKGKQVVLPCVVKNLGFSSIIWFSPNGGAIAKDTNLYSQDDRFSVQHPYKTEYNLAIENIRESDAGVYICMVLGGQSEKHVTLEIQSPPTLDTQRSTPNLKIVMEGDTLSLKCAATGKPEPVISWYRTVETDLPEQTKEDLGTTGPILSIKDIAREAAGSYECVASNNLPPNVSREIIVVVHYKPQVYPQNDQVTKKPGKNVIFECVAEGYPLPQVVWKRNGNVISRTEASYKFRQDVYEEKDSIILSLRINDLNDNDFGIYTCEAENKYGSASHDYTLEKTGAPKIAVASSLVRKIKSENGDLECRVRGFPRSVVWFKNGQKLSPTASRRYAIETYKEDDITVSSLTIVSLEASDFAVYVCQADNEFGSDEMEIRLEQSAIEISGPEEGKVGKDITLVCNATTDSIGKDGIEWLKNGQRLIKSSRITTSRDINTDDHRIYSKLFINKMKLGDKGTYTCRTSNLLVKSHSLSITQVPDDFVNIDKALSSPKDIIRKENSGPIKLMCKVEAFPRIMIFWYKYIGESDGRKQYTEIASGDEMLTLESHRSVAGTYQCRATNGKQSEETLDIDVDIQYPVKVSVTSHRIKKEIGTPLIAECNITGNPIILNYWVSPKGPNSTFDHTLDIAYHENYMTVAMKIMKLKIEDFGQYTCVGGNHLGKDSVSVTILPLFVTTTVATTTTTPTTMPTTEKITKKPTTTTIKTLISTKKPITPVPFIVTTKPIEKTTKKRKPKRTSTPYIPTAEPEYRESDKEQVKQDNRNKSSVMATNYILLTVTVVFAFQKLYS
ncbi:HMCN [Mytilus coruscus]|uniref:HMCN n=1 Tax=Mytilus coruscus TaxID=42192 RepID=A0A6J8BUV6_MYTCO|nr:HMCN [Mytilus coruscus]